MKKAIKYLKWIGLSAVGLLGAWIVGATLYGLYLGFFVSWPRIDAAAALEKQQPEIRQPSSSR